MTQLTEARQKGRSRTDASACRPGSAALCPGRRDKNYSCPSSFLSAFPGLPVSDFRRLGPWNIVDGLVVLRIRKRIRVGNGSVTSCEPRGLKAVLIRHETSRAENEPGSNCWQRWLRSKKEWQYGGWGAAVREICVEKY